MHLKYTRFFLHSSALVACWSSDDNEREFAWQVIDGIVNGEADVFASNELALRTTLGILRGSEVADPLYPIVATSEASMAWRPAMRALFDHVVQVIYDMEASGRITWLSPHRLRLAGLGIALTFGLPVSDAAEVVLANHVSASYVTPMLVNGTPYATRMGLIQGRSTAFQILDLTDVI